MAPERPVAPVAAEPIAVLRPLRQSDVEGVARWYDKAVVLAGERRSLDDLLDPLSARGSTDSPRAENEAVCLVVTRGDTQEPLGLMAVTIDHPDDGWATVALLVVAAPEKRELAAESVALLEAELRRQAKRIRAAVPADVGLALYFWLRLGYRPVATDGRLWMTRDLEP